MAASEPTTTRVVHECSLSPAVYWSLRYEDAYHAYLSAAIKPPVVAKIISRKEEDGIVERVITVTPETNPIPYSLRSMLGCRDGFTFKITERWWKDKFDEAHPMTFVTEPPVMRDRIAVSGSQWVEPHAGGSRLFFELSVLCKVRGVGPMVTKGIADGSLASYKEQPTLALEYVALRRAASGATEAFDRASRMSQMLSDDDDVEDEVAPAAEEMIDDGRRLRARLRWRMALMGVRFRRNVAMAEEEGVRLCTVRIDEPRTDGFGPNRHTSYRICSTIATNEAANETRTHSFESRKRFSEFPALREALRIFLPGIELPALPDKSVPNRLAPEIVELRRGSLELFLQHLLDHPLLATADELAAFLGWPEERLAQLRAPLFSRAKSCYQTPASRQRLAMARVWSLRRKSQGGSSAASPPSSPALSRANSSSVDPGSLSRAPSSVASTHYTSAGSLGSSSRFTSARSLHSRLNSMRSDAEYGAADLADDSEFDHENGSVRKHTSFSDALAAALLRAAEDAAEVVQSHARERLSSNRSSRLTNDDEIPDSASAQSATASTGRSADAAMEAAEGVAANLAARVEAAAAAAAMRSRGASSPVAPGNAAGASSSSTPLFAAGAEATSSSAGADEAKVSSAPAVRVMHQLEDIDARLRAIEALNRGLARRWLWESIVCGCGQR